MNASNPEPAPESPSRSRHLTDDEAICVARSDADFLLQDRADAHARDCVLCRERIRFFEEIFADIPVAADESSPGETIALCADRAERDPASIADATFAGMNADFGTLSTEREFSEFAAALMEPHARQWFRACHALVHGESDEECGDALWKKTEAFLPRRQFAMAELHRDVARALRTHGRSCEAAAQALDELAARSGQPSGLVRDLAQELLTEPDLLRDLIARTQPADLWNGDLRPAESEDNVVGVLVKKGCGSGEGETVVVRLTVEMVSRQASPAGPDGRSIRLYPIPSVALWDLDANFLEAQAEAAAFAESAMPAPCVAEFRWRLTHHSAGPLPAKLRGPSLGLPLGFLLRRMLANPDEKIAQVNLEGVAMTGAITRSGEILRVGSLLQKALHRDHFHTLLAPEQHLVHPDFQPVPGFPDGRALTTRGGELHILCERNVEAAAELLDVDCQTRWEGFDFDPPRPEPDFTGRESLMRNVTEFVRTAESGYASVEGGIGTGKTSFMRELIRRLASEHCTVAFHIVPSQPGAACRGENVAKKIYYHLRRAHVTPEPAAWASWDIVKKLAELLKYLGGENSRKGRKDVIVIDAADQIEPAGEQSLVPDILPADLPPGVICIVSSHTTGEWTPDPNLPARIFRMGQNGSCTDDRADIREYLARQTLCKLPETLIEAMMRMDTPPLFFTVVKRLRELNGGGGTLTEERKAKLLTDAELWVKPAKELITYRIKSIIRSLCPHHDKASEIWDTLGILSVVRGPVSEEVLKGLELWEEGGTNLILDRAASFFLPPDSAVPRHRDPYRFDHPGYPRVIVKKLKPDGYERCHRRIAEKCLHWRNLHGAAERYALEYAPAHLRRAKMWDELYDLLTNFEFLEQRMLRNRPQAGDDGRASDTHTFPQRLAWRVFRDLDRTLFGQPKLPDDHRRRAEIESLQEAVEANVSILNDAPELLVQQLYNDLAWKWGEETDLGKKLRAALKNSHRVILRSLSRREPFADRVRHRTFKGHRKAVNSIALSPDERLLASASDDTTLILWRTDTDSPRHILREHASPVRSVVWNRNGRLLASLGRDVRLWDPHTGKCLRVLPLGDGCAQIAFSPAEDTLAVGGSDGGIRLFSIAENRITGVLREHGAKVRCLAFSSDGRLLAAGTGDTADGNGAVDLYDTGRQAYLRTLLSVRYWVESLAFMPGDTMLVTGGGVEAGEVRCFDVETGHSQRTLLLHRRGILAIAVSPGGVLVTGSADNTVGVRELSTGTVLRTGMAHRDLVCAVAVSRRADVVFSAGADHSIIGWRMNGVHAIASAVAASLARHSHDLKIHASRISPDGAFVITASEDGTARIFGAAPSATCPVFKMGAKPVNIAVFSPDGSKVAIGSDRTLKIFDRATAAELHSLLGHESWILDIAWTPDGSRIISVSQDTRAIVWDARTGAWLRTLQAQTARLRAVAVSPCGRHAATAGDDAKVHLWDLETGQLLRTLHGHHLRVKALAFSPEGLLASAGSDGYILIQHPLTGLQIARLPWPSHEVWTLKFAPRHHLAAGGSDGIARLFDIATSKQVAAFPCSDAVQALWFSEDGSKLLIASRGGADLAPEITETEILRPAGH